MSTRRGPQQAAARADVPPPRRLILATGGQNAGFVQKAAQQFQPHRAPSGSPQNDLDVTQLGPASLESPPATGASDGVRHYFPAYGGAAGTGRSTQAPTGFNIAASHLMPSRRHGAPTSVVAEMQQKVEGVLTLQGRSSGPQQVGAVVNQSYKPHFRRNDGATAPPTSLPCANAQQPRRSAEQDDAKSRMGKAYYAHTGSSNQERAQHSEQTSDDVPAQNIAATATKHEGYKHRSSLAALREERIVSSRQESLRQDPNNRKMSTEQQFASWHGNSTASSSSTGGNNMQGSHHVGGGVSSENLLVLSAKEIASNAAAHGHARRRADHATSGSEKIRDVHAKYNPISARTAAAIETSGVDEGRKRRPRNEMEKGTAASLRSKSVRAALARGKPSAKAASGGVSMEHTASSSSSLRRSDGRASPSMRPDKQLDDRPSPPGAAAVSAENIAETHLMQGSQQQQQQQGRRGSTGPNPYTQRHSASSLSAGSPEEHLTPGRRKPPEPKMQSDERQSGGKGDDGKKNSTSTSASTTSRSNLKSSQEELHTSNHALMSPEQTERAPVPGSLYHEHISSRAARSGAAGGKERSVSRGAPYLRWGDAPARVGPSAPGHYSSANVSVASMHRPAPPPRAAAVREREHDRQIQHGNATSSNSSSSSSSKRPDRAHLKYLSEAAREKDEQPMRATGGHGMTRSKSSRARVGLCPEPSAGTRPPVVTVQATRVATPPPSGTTGRSSAGEVERDTTARYSGHALDKQPSCKDQSRGVSVRRSNETRKEGPKPESSPVAIETKRGQDAWERLRRRGLLRGEDTWRTPPSTEERERQDSLQRKIPSKEKPHRRSAPRDTPRDLTSAIAGAGESSSRPETRDKVETETRAGQAVSSSSTISKQQSSSTSDRESARRARDAAYSVAPKEDTRKGRTGDDQTGARESVEGRLHHRRESEAQTTCTAEPTARSRPRRDRLNPRSADETAREKSITARKLAQQAKPKTGAPGEGDRGELLPQNTRRRQPKVEDATPAESGTRVADFSRTSEPRYSADYKRKHLRRSSSFSEALDRRVPDFGTEEAFITKEGRWGKETIGNRSNRSGKEASLRTRGSRDFDNADAARLSSNSQIHGHSFREKPVADRPAKMSQNERASQGFSTRGLARSASFLLDGSVQKSSAERHHDCASGQISLNSDLRSNPRASLASSEEEKIRSGPVSKTRASHEDTQFGQEEMQRIRRRPRGGVKTSAAAGQGPRTVESRTRGEKRSHGDGTAEQADRERVVGRDDAIDPRSSAGEMNTSRRNEEQLSIIARSSCEDARAQRDARASDDERQSRNPKSSDDDDAGINQARLSPQINQPGQKLAPPEAGAREAGGAAASGIVRNALRTGVAVAPANRPSEDAGTTEAPPPAAAAKVPGLSLHQLAAPTSKMSILTVPGENVTTARNKRKSMRRSLARGERSQTSQRVAEIFSQFVTEMDVNSILRIYADLAAISDPAAMLQQLQELNSSALPSARTSMYGTAAMGGATGSSSGSTSARGVSGAATSSPSSKLVFPYHHIRRAMRGCINWRTSNVWENLDKLRRRRVQERKRVIIIGAGPCGLRLAIELALGGHQPLVFEKRIKCDGRINRLHLWPWVRSEVERFSGRLFLPATVNQAVFADADFCHLGIDELQALLVKNALLLGVEIRLGVEYINAEAVLATELRPYAHEDQIGRLTGKDEVNSTSSNSDRPQKTSPLGSAVSYAEFPGRSCAGPTLWVVDFQGTVGTGSAAVTGNDNSAEQDLRIKFALEADALVGGDGPRSVVATTQGSKLGPRIVSDYSEAIGVVVNLKRGPRHQTLGARNSAPTSGGVERRTSGVNAAGVAGGAGLSTSGRGNSLATGSTAPARSSREEKTQNEFAPPPRGQVGGSSTASTRASSGRESARRGSALPDTDLAKSPDDDSCPSSSSTAASTGGKTAPSSVVSETRRSAAASSSGGGRWSSNKGGPAPGGPGRSSATLSVGARDSACSQAAAARDSCASENNKATPRDSATSTASMASGISSSSLFRRPMSPRSPLEVRQFSWARQFNAAFFQKIEKISSLILENVVYYRGPDTHYIIMTPTRVSLKACGVELSQAGSVWKPRLRDHLRKLLDWLGIHGEFCPEPCDVMAFDFSRTMRASTGFVCRGIASTSSIQQPEVDTSTTGMNKNAAKARPETASPRTTRSSSGTTPGAGDDHEVVGPQGGLFPPVALVGDALLEPFWPEGLGIIRGFLGALDCCWALDCANFLPDAVLLDHATQVFTILKSIHAQSRGHYLQKEESKWDVNPATRYKGLATLPLPYDEGATDESFVPV
ncbi:unnamed protein product [Amoebophrya sp. A25]|nr:unnamed protein product [Amoebophrya sp. A25]|eukprot:GSA25T00012284001.1